MSSGLGFVIADMSAVIMHNVVSVDGFIADANDRIGPLFDWLVNGDVEIIDGGEIKVSQASAGYVKTTWAGIGSMVIGRHLFDITNGWEGMPPAGDHVVVVSHRPKPEYWRPEGFHPRSPPGASGVVLLHQRCGPSGHKG